MEVSTDDYGSVEWFINEYAMVNDDPWGLSWRPPQKIRYARIMNLLNNIQNPISSILDVGCALGDFTYLLAKKYGGKCSVVGIDFVEDAINRAKIKYPQLHFQVGSLFDIGQEYRGQIDLVTCLEVLYYLDRYECPKALNSIKDSLKPGGHVVFSSLISKRPYFSLSELKELVSSEFDIVKAETIHVKLISIFERIIIKIVRLGKRNGFFKNDNYPRNIFGGLPLYGADLIERTCGWMGNLWSSHGVVIGKKM